MHEVWKWPISPGEFVIPMPAGARILTCALQYGEPQVWALVDPAAPYVDRAFVAVGTGHAFPADHAAYVGTFQLHGGALVFHLFDQGEP